MMDTNKIGSGASVTDLLTSAKSMLTVAEQHYAAYEKFLSIRVRTCSPRKNSSNSMTSCTVL